MRAGHARYLLHRSYFLHILHRSEALQAHSHRVWKFIGGISFQSQEIHIPVLSIEAATPPIC